MGNLQREFPVGVARSVVLRSKNVEEGTEVGLTQKTLAIDLGDEPSMVWYCSRWQSFALFRFDDEHDSAPLKKIELETRGINCL